MAPKPWPTDEQHLFLSEQLVSFSEHVKSGTVGRFWPKLLREWAKKWPEIEYLKSKNLLPQHAKLPSGDQGDTGYDFENERFTWTGDWERVYQDALIEREKKLKNWMRNRRKKLLGMASRTSGPSLASFRLGGTLYKRQRAHQEQEVYQRMYADKLRNLVKAELTAYPEPPADADAVTDSSSDEDDDEDNNRLAEFERVMMDKRKTRKSINAWKMHIRRRVIKRCWLVETDEVKAAVREQLAAEKEQAKAMKLQAEEKKGLDRDPQKRSEVIENLTNALISVCDDVGDLSGFSSLLMIGGPHPGLKNEIVMFTASLAYKEKVPPFPSSYDDFQENVAKAFNIWLHRIYTDTPPPTNPASNTQSQNRSTELSPQDTGTSEQNTTTNGPHNDQAPAETSTTPAASTDARPNAFNGWISFNDGGAEAGGDNSLSHIAEKEAHVEQGATPVLEDKGTSTQREDPAATVPEVLSDDEGPDRTPQNQLDPPIDPLLHEEEMEMLRARAEAAANVSTAPTSSNGITPPRTPPHIAAASLLSQAEQHPTAPELPKLVPPPSSPPPAHSPSSAPAAGQHSRAGEGMRSSSPLQPPPSSPPSSRPSSPPSSRPSSPPLSRPSSLPLSRPSSPPLPSPSTSLVPPSCPSTSGVPAASINERLSGLSQRVMLRIPATRPKLSTGTLDGAGVEAQASAGTGDGAEAQASAGPAIGVAAQANSASSSAAGNASSDGSHRPVITNIGSGVAFSQATKRALGITDGRGASTDELSGARAKGNAPRGRGPGRGRGRGRGGRGGAHIVERESVQPTTQTGNGGLLDGAGDQSAGTKSPRLTVTLPSAAERRRINAINAQQSAQTTRGQKRKAVDPLHNPDGRSPLVVVSAPPADKWIQPERSRRERKVRTPWEPQDQKIPGSSTKRKAAKK